MKNMPKFLKTIFIIELFERISYYGVRSLLVLFLINHYKFQDIQAYTIYSVSAALVYLSPVLSAWLTDNVFGFRKLIKLGGCLIAIGQVIILSSYWNFNNFFFGIGFLVLGTGFFKANINSLLGACYKENSNDRTKGFTFLHVGVNIGSALAAILCGYAAYYLGWYAGFSLAASAIFISLFLFFKNEKDFDIAESEPNLKLINKKVFQIKLSYWVFLIFSAIALFFGTILLNNLFSLKIFHIFGIAMLMSFIYLIFKEKEKKELISLGILMLCLIIFFSLQMQLGSLFVVFAQLNVHNSIFGYSVPAIVSQAINPIGVIIFGLFLTAKKNKSSERSVGKFIAGLFAMSACSSLLYLGCLNSYNNQVPYIYLLLAVLITAAGEIVVNPFIQSNFTLLSPKHLRGFIMSLQMLFLSFSNVAGIYISRMFKVSSNDSFFSLEVFKNGFKLLAVYNFALVVILLPLIYFVKKVVEKKLKISS